MQNVKSLIRFSYFKLFDLVIGFKKLLSFALNFMKLIQIN